MTEEELHNSVLNLQTGMNTLTEEWGEFLQIEAGRRTDDATHRKRFEASESQKADTAAENWEKSQTFLNKHGAKILAGIFALITSGLAWYGSQIRGEIQAEQRAGQVDAGIQTNSADLSEFKKTTGTDIKRLQLESVNQTLMMDKGFKRMDKVMIKATRLKEDELPEYPPEFDTAVADAMALKTYAEKFGDFGDKE